MSTGLLDAEPALVNAEHWYQQPIHQAVRGGHADLVRLLLERGAEPGRVRFMDGGWETLLEAARERGHARCLRLLTGTLQERYGYDPEFERLAEAIRSRDRHAIAQALEERSLLERSDCYGNGAVHWAVLTRQPELVAELARRGLCLERRRADGQTPAQLALNGDYRFRSWRELRGFDVPDAETVVRRLVELGAELDLSLACALGERDRIEEILATDPSAADRLDGGRRSPLLYATRAGHAAIVARLLDLGADANRPEERAPRGHALFSAAAANRVDLAELLLAHGADPDAESDSSGCCLTIARARHAEAAQPMLELLRAHGASTPLWELDAAAMKQLLHERAGATGDPAFAPEALARNDPELVDLLADRLPERFARLDGGSLRTGDPDASLTSPEALARLLARGFAPDRGDWLGKTALHHYAGRGDCTNLALLLEHGADTEALEDEHGGTPLAWAAASGQSAAARLLLEHGADPRHPRGHPWAQPLRRAEEGGHQEVAALLRWAIG